MAIINNVAYSWSMITLSSTALGIDEGSTTLEGVSAIKWSKKRKVESNYGMGGRPVSRGFGNITYTASITMDYATQQLLRSVYGSLLEIGEFDLIISFANPMAGEDWTTTTVTLKGCIFTEFRFQNLHSHIAVQLMILCLIDIRHSAGTDFSYYLIAFCYNHTCL